MSKPNAEDFQMTVGGQWIRKSDVCPECDGDGLEWEGWDCEACDGTGHKLSATVWDEEELDMYLSDDQEDYDIWQYCDCEFCNCLNRTEYGGTCVNCQNEIHQG